MKRAIVLVVLAVVVMSIGVSAQAPELKTYTFTEVQNLKLQLLQKDAIYAFQDYQNKLNALNGTAEQFRKDNKWPDGLQFDGQKIEMHEAPKAPATPAVPQAK